MNQGKNFTVLSDINSKSLRSSGGGFKNIRSDRSLLNDINKILIRCIFKSEFSLSNRVNHEE